MKGVSWVNLLLGIWLVVSAAVLHAPAALTSNNYACGVLAVLVAVWALMTRPQSHAAGWIGTAIGLWVLIAPYALGVSAGAVVLGNNGITGALLTIFAITRTLSPHPPSRTVV